MLKNKKKIGRFISLGLCLMMLMSTGLLANAAVYSNVFSFTLASGGGKRQTASVSKTNTYSYACINVTTCQNNSSYSLPYRLRSGANGTEASLLYYMTGTGDKYPTYKSGYGIYGNSYYFRIQTDSNSKFTATVKGSWKP